MSSADREDNLLSRPLAIRAARLGTALYYHGLRTLRVAAARRRLQNAGLILCYHNVVSGDDGRAGEPGLHLSRERFERQMRWLAAHYDVLSLREFIARLAAGATLRSTAAVTFDDGYAGVFDHAVPILNAIRIPATVFVVADAPERLEAFWWDRPEIAASATPARRDRWLNALCGDGAAICADMQLPHVTNVPASHRPADWDTIRARAGNGIDIGVHSATHRSLPLLRDADLEHEIVASRATIHRATGIWPEVFAYPYGLSNPRVHGVVRSAGYRAALGLERGLNDARADVWGLRRINVPAGISDAAFEAWTAGLHGRQRP
jgi:peptidoglycan/xylan/chitin deacetylase (PgdA/CDA1 family)